MYWAGIRQTLISKQIKQQNSRYLNTHTLMEKLKSGLILQFESITHLQSHALVLDDLKKQSEF